MFWNYLKVAIRTLLRQRIYSIINILGLSVGLAGALLIYLYVAYEFSYDKFFANENSIYKVELERKYPSHVTYWATIPHSFSAVIMQNFPDVKQVTRLMPPNKVRVKYRNGQGQEKSLEENFVAAADSNFFLFFGIPFVKGSPQGALRKPNDLVITEATAHRYFGTEDPLGKTLEFFGGNLTVTGVCQNVPDNSHFKFDFVCNITFIPFYKRDDFTGFASHTYVELRTGADYKSFEAKFPKLVDTYAAPQIEQNLGKSWEDYKKEGNGYRYFLQPLTKLHLDPVNFEGKMEAGGNLEFIYFLICVAMLLIAIACINFMNLATARSAERAREVGVRKTMGSLKGQLIGQFLAESILISFIAMALSLVLVKLALPFFSQLTTKNLQLQLSPLAISSLTAIAMLVGFLAGFYPAFILSGFNPIAIMKGHFTGNRQGGWVRNGLVIFQFVVSIILIVGTLVVRQQMQYVQGKSLGFNKEQMLVLDKTFVLDPQKAKTLMEEVSRLPQVIAVGGSSSLPGSEDFVHHYSSLAKISSPLGSMFQPEGSSEILTVKTMLLEDHTAQTLGLELVDGKWFSQDSNDSLNILVNESAARTMGLNNPIGLRLANVRLRIEGNTRVFYSIIGVVKDFHFQSLHNPITPLVIGSTELNGNSIDYIMARIKPGQYENAIAVIESKWKYIAPAEPFQYLFLDEVFNANYKAERQAGKLFAIFAGLAILVACVGLFGLSAYASHLRTKEIGIRKVLGASVGGVVLLLARDFTRMILIAFLIAVPASWYLMKQWLDEFAYRIELSPQVFLLAGVLAILIAWVTVSFQTIRTAIVNPVRSLRSE